MKTLFAVLAGATVLSACVAVPVDPGPAVYAAPPPVVVQPAFGYYYYRGGPYWHRRWR